MHQCPEASVQKSAKKKAYEMAQSLCQRQTGGGVGRWQSVQNTWIIRLRTSWIDCQYAGCMLLHFGFGGCAGDFFCCDQCSILQRGKNLQVRSIYKGEGMPTIVRGTSGMRERSALSELSGLENIRKICSVYYRLHLQVYSDLSLACMTWNNVKMIQNLSAWTCVMIDLFLFLKRSGRGSKTYLW